MAVDRRRVPERNARADPHSVTVLAYGHPNLRGTHVKTFEITAEADVTERATCVIGVRAAIPREISLLRGEVAIELVAGRAAAAGTATINPEHAVRDRAVIRRSDHRDPDTLAVRSTLTAAGLSDEFLDAVRAGEPIRMKLTEVGDPAPLVVLGSPAPDSRLAALVAFRGTSPRAATAFAPAYWIDDWISPAAHQWLTGFGSVRVAAAAPGAQMVAPLLAARLPASPAVLLGPIDRAALRDAGTRQALTGSPLPVAAAVAPAQAAEVLRGVVEVTPERPVAVPDGIVDVGTAMQWLPAADAVARLASAEGEAVPFVVAAGEPSGTVAVAAVLDALRAAGVPARTVAEALAPLGFGRRQLYGRAGVDRPGVDRPGVDRPGVDRPGVDAAGDQ